MPPLTALAFGLAYALLTWVGRLTVVDGQVVSLVWPAAGVAILWFLAESPRRPEWVLVPLMAVHAGVVMATGVSPVLAFFGSLSVTVQTAVVGLLVRRWCPSLLGAGGHASIRSPRDLAATGAAAAIGCVLGALIGTTGLWLDGADVTPLSTLAWFARHMAGVLTVGAVGHLAWEWRTQAVPQRTHSGSRTELVVLWVVSLAATAGLFLQPYPLEFLVIGLAVWSAARFRTFPAAVHCLALGAVAVVLSLTGHGPIAELDGRVVEVLVSQLFMVTLLVTGLAVGALGDRIDELYASATRASRDAAEQAQLLAEMTESMGEGLVVLDRSGRIDRSNGASRRLAHRVSLGAGDDEALARLVDLVLRPAAQNTGSARAELGVGDVVIPLESGEEVVLAVTRTPLAGAAGGGPTGVLLVLREVTDHRSGLRPLANFASTAAHDLRGPLTAIRSWLSIAVEDLEDGSDALAPLRRAERAAEHMGELIGDLLAHALAESGELAAQDVPLCGEDGVLTQAADLLGPDDVLDVPDDLPAVHADPVAVRQLFGNLVDNAVKYAVPGQPARIRVRAHRQGSRVVVEVQDDGVGVEDEERALVFQRFHRSGAVRAHFRGTGMGLSICQTIVQRHGGTIECLAVPPGTGSVFRFDLPAAAEGPP
ncbi:ATP-binding protein [Nocardioides xinjiangensis]|uniref:ATP-binding protein n=1 Tax=Nocardioides xinjiangensis TaxID=2817376 RepID=UPI001B317A72|nr:MULTISPECIES: ATP-binding protein [unclassified Nocardioides]